jgi:hypothetical protein
MGTLAIRTTRPRTSGRSYRRRVDGRNSMTVMMRVSRGEFGIGPKESSRHPQKSDVEWDKRETKGLTNNLDTGGTVGSGPRQPLPRESSQRRCGEAGGVGRSGFPCCPIGHSRTSLGAKSRDARVALGAVARSFTSSPAYRFPARCLDVGLLPGPLGWASVSKVGREAPCFRPRHVRADSRSRPRRMGIDGRRRKACRRRTRVSQH